MVPEKRTEHLGEYATWQSKPITPGVTPRTVGPVTVKLWFVAQVSTGLSPPVSAQALNLHIRLPLTANGDAPVADASVVVNPEVVQLKVLLAVLNTNCSDPPPVPLIALGSGETVAANDADASPGPAAARAAAAPNNTYKNFRKRDISNTLQLGV